MSQVNGASGGGAGPDSDSLVRLLSRFEAAWEEGPTPALDDFVPPGGGRALAELVHIDLERRLRAGDAVRVEEYLGRYPALADRPAEVLDLLTAEYRFRRRREPTLSVAEYRQRFPQYSAALEQRLGESTSPPGPGLAEGSTMPSAADGAGATALSPEAGAGSGPRYRALRFHARGGLGEVWVARDEEFQREVALKRIREEQADDPDSRQRFLREAEITGRLEHPGIVPAYGLTRDADGRPCYAMRLIKGGTLKDAIQRFHEADRPGRDPGERSLALRQLLSRFIAVCQAVAYAHSRGIVHRDLKPSNVMLGEKYGETLLVDWGLAKVVGRNEAARLSDEEGTLRPSSAGGEDTRTGQAVGTLAYMSPEQAAGRWDVVGPASDLYSLGATLYHLLTGQVPFGGGRQGEVVLRVQRGEFPRPRQVKPALPRALEAICLKAMALRAEQRYATALDMAADVEPPSPAFLSRKRCGTGRRTPTWPASATPPGSPTCRTTSCAPAASSGPMWTPCSSGPVAPNRRRLGRCGPGHAGTRETGARGDAYDKGAIRNLGLRRLHPRTHAANSCMSRPGSSASWLARLR
jgi:serine/threonine protein kinase